MGAIQDACITNQRSCSCHTENISVIRGSQGKHAILSCVYPTLGGHKIPVFLQISLGGHKIPSNFFVFADGFMSLNFVLTLLNCDMFHSITPRKHMYYYTFFSPYLLICKINANNYIRVCLNMIKLKDEILRWDKGSSISKIQRTTAEKMFHTGNVHKSNINSTGAGVRHLVMCVGVWILDGIGTWYHRNISVDKEVWSERKFLEDGISRQFSDWF